VHNLRDASELADEAAAGEGKEGDDDDDDVVRSGSRPVASSMTAPIASFAYLLYGLWTTTVAGEASMPDHMSNACGASLVWQRTPELRMLSFSAEPLC
jgi:hypothetical protein